MIDLEKKIKIEFIKKGVSGAEIARQEGVDRTAIYKTIKGEIKSKRLREAICKAIGLPYSIWKEKNREKAA